MRSLYLLTAAAVLGAASNAMAAQITGEYLEARTCSVYTGPCFANAEGGQAGKEAVMAWKVDRGSWNDVKLDGLGAALVLKAEGTLGFDGVFKMRAGQVRSVILVDEDATQEQHDALVAFVKDSADELTKNVVRVDSVPFQLENRHLDGEGVLKAGDLAEIKTRAIQKGDCVCTNEVIYYLPLTDVDNYSPAFSLKASFQGDSLKARWNHTGSASAFLATFRK